MLAVDLFLTPENQVRIQSSPSVDILEECDLMFTSFYRNDLSQCFQRGKMTHALSFRHLESDRQNAEWQVKMLWQ